MFQYLPVHSAYHSLDTGYMKACIVLKNRIMILHVNFIELDDMRTVLYHGQISLEL
jgi:hypothetical protein